jgi:hypothetical protein
MIKALLLTLGLSIGLLQAKAQNFDDVDDKVANLKLNDTLDVVNLARKLAEPFDMPSEKVRAFYYWIANNITMDVKAYTGDADKSDEPGVVLKRRKGTSNGYANLFQEFCSANNIRCLKVDGYAKYSVYDIENGIDQVNHAWNIVQLGKVETQWFNVDVCWAAGIADNEMKNFTKRYTKEWFFTNKDVFSYTHLARITEWRMAYKGLSVKEFLKMPVLREGYVKFGGKKFTPKEAKPKVKPEGKFVITLQLDKAGEVNKVALKLSDDKKAKQEEAVFTTSGNTITITIPNKEGQEIPVYVYLNDYLTLAYYVSFE